MNRMIKKVTVIFRIIKQIYKRISIEIVLIHIGKCGGSTVMKEFNKKNIKFLEKHICRVDYSKNKKYIILVRNPISRFVSSFNWRYKLVCDDGLQSNRFPGEKELLSKYKTVNSLAENIYGLDDKLNIDFSKKKFYIHHITEDINFYIGDFLKKCDRENIIAVLATETLSMDLKENFDINLETHKKKNKDKYDSYLSKKANDNLKRYLKKDYECIEKLYEMGLITKGKYDFLSK